MSAPNPRIEAATQIIFAITDREDSEAIADAVLFAADAVAPPTAAALADAAREALRISPGSMSDEDNETMDVLGAALAAWDNQQEKP